MKKPRMTATWLVAVFLSLVIAVVAPQQLPVTAYKLSLITIAAVVGYYIDRELFPYARPDVFLPGEGAAYAPVAFSLAMLRRSVIVAACVIGVALGA